MIIVVEVGFCWILLAMPIVIIVGGGGGVVVSVVVLVGLLVGLSYEELNTRAKRPRQGGSLDRSATPQSRY